MKTVFSIDGATFPHLRITKLEQTFEILDGENSGRVLTGEMKRDIIGTYFNYNLSISPEKSPQGMLEYNKLWAMCSNPKESHVLVVPFDRGDTMHSSMTFDAYITGGKREMLKYDIDGVDYWKPGSFQFVAMRPKLR